MPRKKEFVREEALALAMGVFWRKGYESTSMQDLVNGMGINRFSLYDSFGSKDELFLESLKLYNNTCIRASLDTLEQSEDGLECIRRVFLDFVHFMKTGSVNGCLMINTMVESGNLQDQVLKICKRYLKSLENAFTVSLERAVARGELPPDTDIGGKAKFLMGSMQGLGVLVKMMSRKDLELYVENIVASLPA